MRPDKNRNRTRDLIWIGFQSILGGTVIIMILGLFCFMFLDKDTNSRPDPVSSGKALGVFLLCGFCGLWAIVRGVIYLIRALSGNERYAKDVEDVVDKFESRGYEAMMKKRMVSDSTRHNVLVLLGWVFLFLAIVGAIYIGYLFLTRPR
jgi:NADH:ubiquinone oxidoreductase subunit 6 (subunit J)